MTGPLGEFLTLDLVPIATASLAAVACAVPGTFLLLRREGLLGDSIAHAVLPGLVIGLLLSGGLAGGAMFAGAAASALLAVGAIAWLRQGGVEPQAAMGATFTAFLAAGILLLEGSGARAVDLDPDCVISGSLESLFWIPPVDRPLLSLESLAALPRAFLVLLVVALLVVLAAAALFKELRAATFDPEFMQVAGRRPALVHAGLSTATAAAVVASFEAVGTVLVVALLVVPAAAARLLTDRLATQVVLAAAIGVLGAVGGHLLGAVLPEALGGESLSSAGSMATLLGAMLALAALVAPEHGILVRLRRRRQVAVQTAAEDLLGWRWRVEELARRARRDRPEPPSLDPGLGRAAEAHGARRGWWSAGEGALTPLGLEEGRRLVRSHRLWERYLVEDLGLRADHVHDTAMVLEHLRSLGIEPPDPAGASLDPQGRPIPRAS